MLQFRTLSQIIRLAVIPEIEARIASGQLLADSLPIPVTRFRFIQRCFDNGTLQPLVEINEEVQLLARAKVTRAVQAGESLTLADIDANDVSIQPPTHDGKPAAYFLYLSFFLNFYQLFDFTPNDPGVVGDEELSGVRYPVTEIQNLVSLLARMNPVEKFRELAGANWPPAPGYYPDVLWYLAENPEKLTSPEFADRVFMAYGRELWSERLGFWKETSFFPNRLKYVEKSVEEFLSGDFIAAIYILIPQFEGTVKDYLRAAGLEPKYRFESCVKQLKQLILSRKLLMFPKELVELVFQFIEAGSFLKETSSVSTPSQQVNRHGIAHGVFTDFETREICLKYLALFDSLGFVLLHDKIVSGTL